MMRMNGRVMRIQRRRVGRVHRMLMMMRRMGC